MSKSKNTLNIDPSQPFFIFDTRGEWHATLLENCLWDARGDYVGFVRPPRYDVYSIDGRWIGNLTPDGRIIRKRMLDKQPTLKIRKLTPARPRNLPPRAPLPPLTADLGYHYVDVLEWDPDALKNTLTRKSGLT